jgi:hypothetical protein
MPINLAGKNKMTTMNRNVDNSFDRHDCFIIGYFGIIIEIAA